jgi:hypothetical protein
MKLRVPLYGSANKIVWVDDEATKGAVAGLNLFLSDGKTLVTDDMLTGGSSGGATATLTTTDDLNEGAYHLYFTDRRAQDAVGGIVGNSANVTLTYTGGTSLVADLTDVTVTSGGTLKKRTFDAKGRLSQESAATTDDLAEGTGNLYYTDARADARISAHAKFPFFASDGTSSPIVITSDLELPFFISSGTASNIPLAA